MSCGPYLSVPQRIGAAYGINFQRDELDGLKRIYGQFLESVIPTGDTQLKVGCALMRYRFGELAAAGAQACAV